MLPLLDGLDLSLQRAMPCARPERCRRPLSAPLSPAGKEDYMSAMESLLTVLVPLAMLATLVVLGFGVVQMIRGGDPRRSNKLMQYRVVFQGLALLLFALLMMVFKRCELPHRPADAHLHPRRRCRRDLPCRLCARADARTS